MCCVRRRTKRDVENVIEIFFRTQSYLFYLLCRVRVLRKFVRKYFIPYFRFSFEFVFAAENFTRPEAAFRLFSCSNRNAIKLHLLTARKRGASVVVADIKLQLRPEKIWCNLRRPRWKIKWHNIKANGLKWLGRTEHFDGISFSGFLMSQWELCVSLCTMERTWSLLKIV